jgi:pimeloyl-ACP methyl ester carboxylesterase
VSEQAEDLAALITRLDAAPALLVGADFGALVVLDAVLRHRGLIRGAVLVDPPVYAFVAQADRGALRAARRPGGRAALLGPGRGGELVARRHGAPRQRTRLLRRLRRALVARAVASGARQGLVPGRDRDERARATHDRAAAEALLAELPGAKRFEDVTRAVRGVGG